MMQKHLIAIALLFVFQSLIHAQCENGQLTSEVFGEISNEYRHNNAFTYGMVSYQSHADNFYYESDENPAFYLGYGKSIWAAAKDQSGNLKLAANTFPTLSRHEFIAGPLDRATGQPLDTLCNVYNRVWIIKEIDVFLMRSLFERGLLTIEDIPTDILEWPAKGNPHLEELAPDFDLAPFHDVAEDGVYDPLSGDYPIALEENPEFVPHQFSFIVFNDRSQHRETGGASIGLEFHQMNYVVNCSEESESEQTVFTRMKYHYLGDETLSELRLSLWEDNDLACNQNDYTGCDLEMNCSYFYNESGETFLDTCHDPDVPDNNGAVRTTVFLDHDIKTFKHWYLLGVGDTIPAGIDPTGAEEYYRYMSGQWRDGSSMSTSGQGYDPGSTETTLFAFPDRPNDPAGWSMQTAGIPIPLDVRALSTLIIENDVEPGHSGKLDFADHFLYDKVNKRLEVFDTVWPEAINKLKEDYNQMLSGDFDCGSGLEICLEDCVWPGDANNDGGVDGKDILFAGMFAAQEVQNAPPRGLISTEWFGFNAEEWPITLFEVNSKHGDVNGNGVINESDLEGLVENFGLTRDGYVPSQRVIMDLQDPRGLRSVFEVDTIDLQTAMIFDLIVKTEIFLGGLQGQLGEPLSGLSFEMQFDTNLVAPFNVINDVEEEIFDFGYGGMPNGVRVGQELQGDDKIQYGFTNLDARETRAGGLLVGQNLFIREDAKTANPDGVDTLAVRFFNVCAVDAAGAEVEIGVFLDSLIITGLVVDPNVISSTKAILETSEIQLFPNPAKGLLYVDMGKTVMGNMEILDQTGTAVRRMKATDEQRQVMDVSGLASGVYVLRFVSDDGVVSVKRFVKS